MKKLLLFLIVLGSTVFAFSSDFETLLGEFVQIRSMQDSQQMSEFITKVEKEDLNDYEILTLLADCHREYANWIEDKKTRESHYKTSRELAEKAIKLNPN